LSMKPSRTRVLTMMELSTYRPNRITIVASRGFRRDINKNN
jgi:hypothetical protein